MTWHYPPVRLETTYNIEWIRKSFSAFANPVNRDAFEAVYKGLSLLGYVERGEEK